MRDQRSPHFLDGGGDATDEILSVDWSATSLGPIEDWPISLKTAVGMMVSSRFPKAIFWGPDLLMLYNDAFRPILGNKPKATGRPMREIWAEIWPQVGPIAERAMRGEATFLKDMQLEIDRGEFPEQCYFTFCYSPIRDEAGRVGGFIDTVIETTGTVEAEHALRVQNAELSHRIQNTLAIVASIARQTLRSAKTPGAAWEVLSDRLRALAETHNLLKPGRKSRAAISDVVRAALRPHGGDSVQFEVSGPLIEIPERQALALSLAVNELATNAVKHGALSVEGGRIAVAWGFVDDGGSRRLRFQWRERGGPTVMPPQRRSFGTTLIQDVVPQDFGGEARIDYAPLGLVYELSCDVKRLDD